MEDRIAVLERDVNAIKSELAVMRLDRQKAAELDARVARIELDVTVMKVDLSQVKIVVLQLQKDVADIKEEFVELRISLTRLAAEQSQFATKADLLALKADVKGLEANLKGWMLVIALSLMTSMFAMIYPLYGALRPPPVVKPAQSQHVVPQSGTPSPAVP